MIQQILIGEMTIKEFERKLSVKASGKILSVSVKLEPGVDISIITELGEQVISVNKNGVYYPRANISSEKERSSTLTGEVQTIDYYYFAGSLLIELNAEGEMNGEIALNELIILYDDMQ